MSGPSPRFLRLRRVAGGLGAVSGAGLTLLALVALNGGLPAPPDRASDGAVSFDVPPPPPPPPSAPKPKPKPKPRRSDAAPPPPSLGAGLAGLSFGLPGLDGVLDGATEALLGDVGDVVMTEDAVDAPPRPTQRVAAEYPPRARQKGVTGHVTLSLLVGGDGAVQDVRVLEARPPGVFEDAAIAAVRAWRFRPATYQGRPVAVRARQTLRFELE